MNFQVVLKFLLSTTDPAKEQKDMCILDEEN